jgi:hypothetical protein
LTLSLEGCQVGRVIGYGLVYDLYRNNAVKHCVPGPVYRTLATSGYPIEYLVSAYSLQHGL